MPRKTLAGNCRGVTESDVADGQVQCDYTVATAGVGESVRVVTGRGDVHILIPVEEILGDSGGVAGIGVPDGQIQGDHGIAACRIGQQVGCGIVVLDVGDPVNPSESVASVAGVGEICWLKNSEGKGRDRVATCDSRWDGMGQNGVVNGCGLESESVEKFPGTKSVVQFHKNIGVDENVLNL